MRFPKAGSIQAKERILLRYTMGFQNSKTSGHPGQVETILVTTGDWSETITAVKVGSNILTLRKKLRNLANRYQTWIISTHYEMTNLNK